MQSFVYLEDLEVVCLL